MSGVSAVSNSFSLGVLPGVIVGAAVLGSALLAIKRMNKPLEIEMVPLAARDVVPVPVAAPADAIVAAPAVARPEPGHFRKYWIPYAIAGAILATLGILMLIFGWKVVLATLAFIIVVLIAVALKLPV